MGGDSLIRIFLTNMTSITQIQTPVSLRTSFGQPRFFQRHYVAVWSLEVTVRFEFCPVFATVERGLPGWTLWF